MNSRTVEMKTTRIVSTPTVPHNVPAAQLVVVDDGNRRLHFLDLTTHVMHESMDLGDGDWSGLCIHQPHPHSEEVFVAVSDIESNTVMVFDMKSKRLVRSIGEGGAGSAHGQLQYPFYLCMYCPADAGAAALLVSCESGHAIHMFDFESGTHIQSIGGGKGSDPGQLSRPGAIAVWTPQDDPTNAQVVVADIDNHRLQFFRLSDGMYVRSIESCSIRYPMAMSIHRPAGGRDEDALLVTIGSFDCRIHVLSVVSGEYLRYLGRGEGRGVDQLRDAVCIAFYRPVGEAETETQVIISDRDNHRLQVFNLYSGAHMYSIGGGDSGLFKTLFCVAVMSGSEDDSWNYVLK